MDKIKDRTNVKYGRLTAKYVYDIKNGKIRWFCECSCGGTCVVAGGSLTTGNTESCGCLKIEKLKLRNRGTHGKSHTPEHNAWIGMRARCYNKNNKHYKNYGAHGIIVCPRWKDSFDNFFAAMGERPSKEHSIDRIENEGTMSRGIANGVQEQSNKVTNKILNGFMLDRQLAVGINQKIKMCSQENII